MYQTLIASDAPTIENFSAALTTDGSGNQTITVSGVVVSATEGAFISDALVLSYYAWGGEASFVPVTGNFSAVTNGAFSITLSRPTFPVTATAMGVKLTVRDSEGVSVTLLTPLVSLIAAPSPTLTITTPLGGSTIDEETILTFETSSEEGVLCALNGGEPLLCTSGVLLSSLFDIETLAPGEYTLTLELVENDEVTAEVSVQIPEPPLPIDTTPPTVVLATPEDGALDVAVDTSVSLLFSEEVIFSEDSVLLTSSLEDVVPHSVTSEDLTYTVTPDNALTEGETYTLALSNVVDTGGNELASFTMSFTVHKKELAVPSGNGARSAYDVPPPVFLPAQTPLSEGAVQTEATSPEEDVAVTHVLPEEIPEETVSVEAVSATPPSQGGAGTVRGGNSAGSEEVRGEVLGALHIESVTETSYVGTVVAPEVRREEPIFEQSANTRSSLGASAASSFVEKTHRSP